MNVKKPRRYRFANWISVHIYTILYIAVLVILTRYIICNWEKCISMQFFSQFDGNNILFLVWIASIVLFFYDIEAKGWKFHLRGNKEMQEQFDSAESAFFQNQINDIRIKDSIQPQNLNEMGVTSSDE